MFVSDPIDGAIYVARHRTRGGKLLSNKQRILALVYERTLLSLNHMPDQPRQKPPPREGHGPEA